MHAGSFHVSIIHRTLAWTTGSVTCVRDHSYACIPYTQGLGTPTASQRNIFNSEKLTNFSCAVDRVRTLGQRISLESDVLQWPVKRSLLSVKYQNQQACDCSQIVFSKYCLLVEVCNCFVFLFSHTQCNVLKFK